MPRIMVYLDEARCQNTEDVSGADELYVLGAIKTNSAYTSGGFVTQPISINDGQNRKFGPGGGYVFDKTLSNSDVFQVEMAAFDEDASKSAADYQRARDTINRALAATPNPAASTVGSLTLDVVNRLIQLDKDDQLHATLKPFSVSQLPNGWSLHRWNFQEDGIGWSTWKYEILYWVGKF